MPALISWLPLVSILAIALIARLPLVAIIAITLVAGLPFVAFLTRRLIGKYRQSNRQNQTHHQLQ